MPFDRRQLLPPLGGLSEVYWGSYGQITDFFTGAPPLSPVLDKIDTENAIFRVFFTFLRENAKTRTHAIRKKTAKKPCFF